MSTYEGKRSLEDIAATQAEQGLLLGRVAERLDHHTTLLNEHSSLLKAIETAIQLLAGNITNMRTELLVIKSLIASQREDE